MDVIPTASPMMSLFERPDEDAEEVPLFPALLPVPLPGPLLLLDGELDGAVCIVVLPPIGVTERELDATDPPLGVTDDELDATDFVPVGAESATGPTTIVEVVVGVPGSMVPAEVSWLQVSNIAAIAPL